MVLRAVSRSGLIVAVLLAFALAAVAGVGPTPREPISRAGETYQPDGMIKTRGDKKFYGNNVYNLTGYKQTRTRTIHPGRRATFTVRFQNDSSVADGVVILGRKTAGAYKASYFQGSNNITKQATGSGFVVSPLQPGESTEVRVKIRATVRAEPIKSFAVSAASQAVAGAQDVVVCTVRVRR